MLLEAKRNCASQTCPTWMWPTRKHSHKNSRKFAPRGRLQRRRRVPLRALPGVENCRSTLLLLPNRLSLHDNDSNPSAYQDSGDNKPRHAPKTRKLAHTSHLPRKPPTQLANHNIARHLPAKADELHCLLPDFHWHHPGTHAKCWYLPTVRKQGKEQLQDSFRQDTVADKLWQLP